MFQLRDFRKNNRCQFLEELSWQDCDFHYGMSTDFPNVFLRTARSLRFRSDKNINGSVKSPVDN